MPWRASDKTGHPQQPRGRELQRRRSSDRTDYEHRYFVNLVAAAFVLALAFAIGWTMQAFDRQRALERCLESGRKECRQVADPGIRGHIALPKY